MSCHTSSTETWVHTDQPWVRSIRSLGPSDHPQRLNHGPPRMRTSTLWPWWDENYTLFSVESPVCVSITAVSLYHLPVWAAWMKMFTQKQTDSRVAVVFIPTHSNTGGYCRDKVGFKGARGSKCNGEFKRHNKMKCGIRELKALKVDRALWQRHKHPSCCKTTVIKHRQREASHTDVDADQERKKD